MQDETLELKNNHTVGVSLKCGAGHTYFVPYTCSPKNIQACPYCVKTRSGLILYQLFRKLAGAGYGIMTSKGFESGTPEISMWTFGTNVDYEYYYDYITEKWIDNLSDIIIPWQKFSTRAKVYLKRSGATYTWTPLFYVVESGSSGGKLHIHALVFGFFSHTWALEQWRDIIGYNANVHYTPSFNNIGYLAKYTSKGALTYRFMGPLYKIKLPDKDKSCRYRLKKDELCGESFYVDMQNVQEKLLPDWYEKFHTRINAYNYYIRINRWNDGSMGVLISMERWIDGSMDRWDNRYLLGVFK